MSRVFFITHPDVAIDPSVPVADWPLNERGRSRMYAMTAWAWAIESRQGDMLRQFPSSLAGRKPVFFSTNRGKRAIALDLKRPEGLAVLHLEIADVLVENFRPSVPAQLSIDYPRLKAINPLLLDCGLTSYGDSGLPVRLTPKPQ